MDIALAIEHILPAADYNGSTTDNTEISYYSIVWKDTRKPKPTWLEIKNAWKEISTPKIEDVRATKLKEIMDKCNEAFAPIDAVYPSVEREGWYAQEAEAIAVTANNTASTPILTKLVKLRNRNETVLQLAAKVIENATAWRISYASIIGKQQKMYAKVMEFTTIAEIEAYVVDYVDPIVDDEK